MTGFFRRRGRYLVLGAAAALAAYAAVVVAADWDIVAFIFSAPDASLAMRAMLFMSVLLSPGAHIGSLSLLIMALTTGLFGTNVALMAYQVDRGALGEAQGIIGTVIGGIAGLLGVGCAACGALFISGLLALTGLAGALAYLPLHGVEFAYAGLVFMAVGTALLVREARRPLVC